MTLPLPYLSGPSGGNVDLAPGPSQSHPERAVANRSDGVAVKDDTETSIQPTRVVTDDISGRDSRSAAVI